MTRRSSVYSADKQPARIGKYTILRRLAQGRVSQLFLARTEGIGKIPRNVVIKVLRTQLAHSDRFVSGFLHEERVSSILNHPNVIQFLDSGESDNGYYIVTEHIEGWSIQDIIARLARKGKRIPLDIAVNIIYGVASALHYIHELQGTHAQPLDLVHRDVTPANIMVTRHGWAKLIDFGDVAITGMDRARPAVVSEMSCYTPPEMLRQERVCRRGDLYSLGAVLYELTTGKPALPERFSSEDSDASNITPPTGIFAEYWPELENIVMNLLDPDPNRRFQTAAALQFALEELALTRKFSLSPRRLGQFLREQLMTREPARPRPTTETLDPDPADSLAITSLRELGVTLDAAKAREASRVDDAAHVDEFDSIERVGEFDAFDDVALTVPRQQAMAELARKTAKPAKPRSEKPRSEKPRSEKPRNVADLIAFAETEFQELTPDKERRVKAARLSSQANAKAPRLSSQANAKAPRLSSQANAALKRREDSGARRAASHMGKTRVRVTRQVVPFQFYRSDK